MRVKHHILVIRLSAMGDVAMMVPVLKALTTQHKNVRVTIVSRAFFKPFFAGIPKVDFYSAEPNRRHKGLKGILKLYKELKALHITSVADLHNVIRSKIVTALFKYSGKNTATVDKARAQRAALIRPDNKVFEPLTAVTKRYAEVFDKLGFPVKLETVSMPERLDFTPDVLAFTGTRNGYWVGIAPFAKHRSKVYPDDLMQKVITELAAKPDTKLFLFGAGKSEVRKLEKYAKAHSNVIVAAGRTSLVQELQLISNLDVMLSMDSSNAHMAAMYGVNTVTLWGATHPYAGFAPYNQPMENALVSDREKYPKLPTSVYGDKKISGYEDVMRTISPQKVVESVSRYLG